MGIGPKKMEQRIYEVLTRGRHSNSRSILHLPSPNCPPIIKANAIVGRIRMNRDVGMAISAKSPNQKVALHVTGACVCAPLPTWKCGNKTERFTHITTQASIPCSRKETCRFSAPTMQVSAKLWSTLPLLLDRTRICGVDASQCVSQQERNVRDEAIWGRHWSVLNAMPFSNKNSQSDITVKSETPRKQ